MAAAKREELAAIVADACEGLADCGFLGLIETPVLKTLTDLHKFNDTERLSTLIAAMEEAATRMISAKAPPGFPELMVVSQLLLDVEGPGAPPDGTESPLDSDFRSLGANLRLALCASLMQFAKPGSEEAAQGLDMAVGMLLILHEKVAGDTLSCLAVEHAILRLLGRRKAVVALLRDRIWALTALNKQVAALASYKPEAGGGEAADDGDDGGAEEGGDDEEVMDDDDDDDDDDEEEIMEVNGDEETGADGQEQLEEEVVEEEEEDKDGDE
ncbi:hypothetical protein VOLCADRAFT_120941 [Volvox carteri f. nagariensis]|uniref:Uncharacterized protein n=1 Tax=Volvox carteri f. nagariensis TaxID=3068 RepID=D8TXN6_VOLCA|nr:uncharacterized protein VOLCADRAFT_120941 [Volvox carteri f. nagariensis]EFJ47756.1 hypothetical protein VOLCADRAFT_120941 [Volvox carteri f. nagariensis]|eukprot:XP_002951227.1 hypothetical protein VOLCADRAFT_120941 [Volvox carteri f. nagariensis]